MSPQGAFTLQIFDIGKPGKVAGIIKIANYGF
jgi:hypothetical protein